MFFVARRMAYCHTRRPRWILQNCPRPPEDPIKRFVSAVLTLLLLVASLVTFSLPARADVICTKTADPATHGGLQALLNKVRDAGSADPIACIPSGTYSINFALVIPVTMKVIGTGLTPPVIDCTAATYCFDGTAGPSSVSLENLSMDGAHKADIQIGSGAPGSPVVTGWTLTGITTTGAGQVGITMNNATGITISNATITGNGSAPYDPSTNPTGDFGLRANKVDSLTLQDSFIANNPTTPSPNPGFSGGAKFNTTTNLLVHHNDFTGNAGGGQLWIDISSRDFEVSNNTIEEVPTAGTGQLPNDAIRVEVSCVGSGSNLIHDNTIAGGVVAAIDIYDSSGVTMQDNAITVPQAATPNFGIRMFGNTHDPGVPDTSCMQAGTFPNSNNTSIGNAIDMSNTGNALNGVKNVSGGMSAGNVWTGNAYTLRHCDPPSNGQWTWWDGSVNQRVGYAGWQGFAQDVDAGSSCTSIYPQIDADAPFDPAWGPAGTQVTIHGSGFANVTSVKFNGVAATFTHTDAQITATVPPSATTGPVCVKNALNTTCSTTSFIVASPIALNVTPAGTGVGEVTSLAPYAGIDCGATCQSDFPQGASVELQATADSSSTFAGWAGACSGTGSCTLTMDAAQEVTATFTLVRHTLSVTQVGTGTGVVTSDVGAINCGGVCSDEYDHGSVVTLTATPDANMTFDEWGGACSGPGTCQVTMDAAEDVTTTFTPVQHTLTVTNAGSGTGTITSDTGGIDCQGTCMANFDHGATIVLTATPGGGSLFAGWSGACSGSSTCNVTMDAARAVTATFTIIDYALTVTNAGIGTGTIMSDTGGINCPGTCMANYLQGATVVLTAAPSGTATFAGWSGACTGMGTCSVSMDGAKSVTGTFNHQDTTSRIGDNDPAVAYNGWVGVADASANGGFYRMSNIKNDKATWKSPATTSITWVTRTGPDQGKASVSIDGKSKGTVDLYSASATTLTKVYSALSNKAHTVVITVLHTRNTSSSGFSVRLDAFVVGATTTQESDKAIQWDTWKSMTVANATDGTYRSASAAKSSVTATFTGTAIDWVTTRGKAYGKASVTIDGVSKGTFDMYQAATVWQSLITFAGLSSGPHSMVIKVLGQKNASATGTKVVVDGFIAHA